MQDTMVPTRALELVQLSQMTENAKRIFKQALFGMLNGMATAGDEAQIEQISSVIDLSIEENSLHLTGGYVRLYEKYYTAPEIDILIDFFSTEVGQKYIASSQVMNAEVVKFGEEWGAKVWSSTQDKLGWK